jgi:hypothetical protein
VVFTKKIHIIIYIPVQSVNFYFANLKTKAMLKIIYDNGFRKPWLIIIFILVISSHSDAQIIGQNTQYLTQNDTALSTDIKKIKLIRASEVGQRDLRIIDTLLIQGGALPQPTSRHLAFDPDLCLPMNCSRQRRELLSVWGTPCSFHLTPHLRPRLRYSKI